MANAVIILMIAAIVFLAGRYIYREKKRGKTCVGCPYGGNCSGGCSGCGKEKN